MGRFWTQPKSDLLKSSGRSQVRLGLTRLNETYHRPLITTSQVKLGSRKLSVNSIKTAEGVAVGEGEQNLVRLE